MTCRVCDGNNFVVLNDGTHKTCVCVENDAVENPQHYTTGDVECIDAITAAISDLDGIEAHATGSAIAYLWRWKKKGGFEDLRKARWYINRLLLDA